MYISRLAFVRPEFIRRRKFNRRIRPSFLFFFPFLDSGVKRSSSSNIKLKKRELSTADANLLEIRQWSILEARRVQLFPRATDTHSLIDIQWWKIIFPGCRSVCADRDKVVLFIPLNRQRINKFLIRVCIFQGQQKILLHLSEKIDNSLSKSLFRKSFWQLDVVFALFHSAYGQPQSPD